MTRETEAGVIIDEVISRVSNSELTVPYLVCAKDWQVHSLERFLDEPTRLRQTLQLHDLDSFAAAIANETRYPDPDREDGGHLPARVYFNRSSFVAIFDWHSWGDNRAIFSPTLSQEWNSWNAANKKKATQQEFAEFLENNVQDIIDPDGATLLETARNLEAKKDVSFSSAIRLSDGQIQFSYSEEVTGSSRKGQLEIPATFTISIPVFERTPGWLIECRLRYRIDSGHLSMWYEMDRPWLVLRNATDTLVGMVESGIGFGILRGDPGPKFSL